jgi:ketosteroid isomerase-like protein
MSRENVEMVERGYDAYQRGDLEAFAALHHPECEFAPLNARVEGGGPYRGRDGVRRYWDDLLSVFEDWQPVAQEIRDHGDLMIVRLRVTGRARESGVMFDETFWQAVKVRDGLVTWWETCRSEAEALEAAGLRE